RYAPARYAGRIRQPARAAPAGRRCRRYRRADHLRHARGDGGDPGGCRDAPDLHRPARRALAPDTRYRVASDGGRIWLERGTAGAGDRVAHPLVSDAMSAFVVVNPRSGNGRTGREWNATARKL